VHYKQSKEWSQYLATLGWKTKPATGGNLYYRSLPLLGNLGKAPRLILEKPASQIPQLVDDLKKEKIRLVTLEPEFSNQPKLLYHALQNNGFKPTNHPLTPPLTLITNLNNDENELKKNLHTLAQRQIKKARQKNILVSTYRWPIPAEQLNDFYQLACQTADRQHCFRESFDQLINKANLFKDKCFLVMTSCHDQPAAGVFLLIHDQIAYYHHAASGLLAHQTGAAYLAAWETINLSKKLGCQKFDFEGIYDPRYPKYCTGWQGFSEFKKKFGGEELEYPKVWRRLSMF